LEASYYGKGEETADTPRKQGCGKRLSTEYKFSLLTLQEFRRLDDSTVSYETVGLSLDLADFAPSNLYTGNDEKLFIAATTLKKFLEDAENHHAMIMQGKGEQMVLEGYTMQ
jgi:hypothetical protein